MSAFVLKLLLGVLGFTTVVGGLTAAWFYVQDLQSDNELLAKEVAQKERVIGEQQAAFDAQAADIKKVQQLNSELNRRYSEAQNSLERYRERLAEHDLDMLAKSRPELVQKIINGQAVNERRCTEIVLGSPLTEEELAAVRPSQINPACYEYANPNFNPDDWEEWKRRNQ